LSESELIAPLWGEINAPFYEGGFLLLLLCYINNYHLIILLCNNYFSLYATVELSFNLCRDEVK
ncbi:hypothetical protein, partial [Xenorhabdus bovienii]|uniref:hypothetical protein n=1 Tax=Xenorhabdus bovienii TaxID=40576 RepID=UPI001E42C1BE